MLSPISVLPLQLACQLLTLDNDTSLVNVNIDTQTPKLPTELPDGYVVFPSIGVAYKFYENKSTWNEARKYCEAHGANLAVIDSYEKLKYLQSIKTGSDWVNIGIHRLFDKTEWVDVKNGSPVKRIPWAATTNIADRSRNCIATEVNPKDGVFVGTCHFGKSFVCEIPIYKN